MIRRVKLYKIDPSCLFLIPFIHLELLRNLDDKYICFSNDKPNNARVWTAFLKWEVIFYIKFRK